MCPFNQFGLCCRGAEAVHVGGNSAHFCRYLKHRYANAAAAAAASSASSLRPSTPTPTECCPATGESLSQSHAFVNSNWNTWRLSALLIEAHTDADTAALLHADN